MGVVEIFSMGYYGVFFKTGDIGTSHSIEFGTTYKIPDAANNAIFVANEPIKEKLLVIVTSTASRKLADEIATRMSQTNITKADSGQITENWGVELLEYEVGL